jgi:DNA helicase HerA-like ATPase
MAKRDDFISKINEGYNFEGESLVLGGAVFEGETIPGTQVKIPLRMMNRHGLIAGATGTGKTKTLQVIAEQLSANSVPVLLMDIKGDLSGVAVPGNPNPKIEERHQKIGLPYSNEGFPVELLSLSAEKGVRLRATVTEFGPVLFTKILGLNDTQGGVVAVVFKYCDDNDLPLLDLKDFKKALQYISEEGKEEVAKEYGAISSASVGTIIRKVLELEQQGADIFFGEPSFEVEDLCRIDPDTGKGIISILRLTDIQDKPKLFSTFMLSLLAEIYATFPEAGDVDAPKLVIFIDEAHLVFEEASNALLDQLEAIIKLIRSKGIGIFFCTQNPADIPEDILGQLGLKVQHALRAFTAKDRQAIKLAAQNYPLTDYYDTAEVITQLGIGEAFVTALSQKGVPTPLVHTMLRAPQSRMDVLSDMEIDSLVGKSKLVRKYNQTIDEESAYEILSAKIDAAQAEKQRAEMQKQQEKAASVETGRSRQAPQTKSVVETVMKSSAAKSVLNTVARELSRGLLGVLGLGGKSQGKSTRKKSWF